MADMINNENFIGIYPNGINNSWNSGVISYDEGQSQADDYGFTIKMIDWMKTNTRIDENRIFAFGQSAGAMFLYEQVVSRQHFELQYQRDQSQEATTRRAPASASTAP